jgi:O-antigen ligase
MKNRAATISEYETESSAATRLQAWDAAWGMMTTHPITGVGLTGMGPAFPVFSANKPRVAHNAFFQTGAESGILALLAYIGIFILALLALVKKTRFEAWQKGSSEDYYLYLLNEATLASLTGFAVCALFLSLNNNEIFFYLLLLANFFYVNKAAADNSSNSLSERERT